MIGIHCNFGLLNEHADALNSRIWAGLRTSSQKIDGYLDFLQEEGGIAISLDSLIGFDYQNVKLEELLSNPIIVEQTEISRSLRIIASLCEAHFSAREMLRRESAYMLLDATIEKVKNSLDVLKEARIATKRAN